MNTRNAFCIAGLAWLAATAVFLVGCHGHATSTRVTTTAPAPAVGAGDAAWEYKTLDTEESPDRELAIAQMKARMQQFQHEGWLVRSISKPLPQSDGTIHRKYNLARLKQ